MRFVVIAAFSAIPLQWFLLAESPAGDIRLHQLAAILLTAVIVFRFGLPRLERGIRGVHLFIAANIYLLILWVALNVFNGLGMSQPIKQLTFLATFLAVTALFYFAVLEDDHRLIDTLRWTAAASVTVMIAAFGFSLLSNGVNPIEVVQRSIEAGDPNLLQKELFRSSFAAFGYGEAEEALGNLRHEVFGGLLFTMYVASWANARRPLVIPRQRNLYRAAMVIGSGLLLISLSRSILVAAAIWPLVSFYRAMLTGRVSARQQVAVIAGLIGAAVLAATGFLELLWTRFTEETQSYDVREDLVALALVRIQDNFWMGGIDTVRTSSHNFVLDNWQRGGIFVGLPALFIFLYLSYFWLQLLLRVRTVPDELVPLVAAMALPCVRLVTQGGGSLQIVEWVTLAFVMGVLVATREVPEGSGHEEPQGVEPDAAIARRQAAASLPPTQAAVLKQLRATKARR